MFFMFQFWVLLFASFYFLFLFKNLSSDRVHVILTSGSVGFVPCLDVLHSWWLVSSGGLGGGAWLGGECLAVTAVSPWTG